MTLVLIVIQVLAAGVAVVFMGMAVHESKALDREIDLLNRALDRLEVTASYTTTKSDQS